MMRQISKQMLSMGAPIRFFMIFATLILAGAPAFASNLRLNSDVVVDPLSGVALNGYDPISYFTDAEPLPGRRDFELIWQGVPWFFSSQGNMEIFSKAPEIYAPQFGGHGVMSLSRGFFSDGNPLIYKVLDNRLYLFYSFSNRAAFEQADKIARVEAIGNWQDRR
ncbi:MAG: YHS domain-containing protein [Devosiaceae bacterium]|nr:YHS domain-containing protein [Devosiaceae bacterium]